MKRQIVILGIFIFALSTILVSCTNFLEQPEKSGDTDETVFSSMNKAEQILAGAYAFPNWGFVNPNVVAAPMDYGGLIYGAPISFLSDESETSDKGIFGAIYMRDGGLTAELSGNPVVTEFKWDMEFQSIRSAYLFLDKVDMVKDGTPVVYIAKRKDEAKTFIASKYYEILKRFGGVPWVGGYIDQSKIVDNPRLSIDESVTKICALLDEVISDPAFPDRTDGIEFGRCNKIAARVLKARTLLWSASPIFNTVIFPAYGVQKLVRHENIDPAAVKQRWTEAMKAASDAIAAANAAGYHLIGEGAEKNDSDAKSGIFYRRAINDYPKDGNTEIIWGTIMGQAIYGNEFQICYTIYDKIRNPTSQWQVTVPSQNLVEHYETKSGDLQDPSTRYDNKPLGSDLYSDLEARFQQSISFHGQIIGSPNVWTMDMIDANRLPDNKNFTGYYMHKFFNDNAMTAQVGATLKENPFWPYIRLAELYLIYAEAANEVDQRTESLKYLNLIRNRSGQPNLESLNRWVNSQDYLRKCIKNERMVELAFEGHRYFDLKRWLMGDASNRAALGGGSIAGELNKINISDKGFSRGFLAPIRPFTDKWYFYPIPAEDINVTRNLVQNPNW